MNYMDNDIVENRYSKIEYYMSRGNNLYFRNSDHRVRVDCTGTEMKSYLIYGDKYNLELSIFADSNEF